MRILNEPSWQGVLSSFSAQGKPWVEVAHRLRHSHREQPEMVAPSLHWPLPHEQCGIQAPAPFLAPDRDSCRYRHRKSGLGLEDPEHRMVEGRLSAAETAAEVLLAAAEPPPQLFGPQQMPLHPTRLRMPLLVAQQEKHPQLVALKLQIGERLQEWL